MSTAIIAKREPDRIPPFTASGYLPEGDYEPEWAEFVARYSFSARRQELLENFWAVAIILFSLGVERFKVAGSFVTEKLEPSDIDVLVHKDFQLRLQNEDLSRLIDTRKKAYQVCISISIPYDQVGFGYSEMLDLFLHSNDRKLGPKGQTLTGKHRVGIITMNKQVLSPIWDCAPLAERVLSRPRLASNQPLTWAAGPSGRSLL